MSLFNFLIILVCFYTTSHLQAQNLYRVTRNNHTFSTTFEMSNKNSNFGGVEKCKFHLATQYDSYDTYGNYEGQGLSRLFSLGFFYTWGAQIDIFNEIGQNIGMIDGHVMNFEPGSFSFYDQYGNCLAIACFDKKILGFNLIDPINSNRTLARLIRHQVSNLADSWEVINYHPEIIPPLLVKIFAAFACDKQKKFARDL